MAYYKELTPVPNTGGEVYIHKLKTAVKGNWYCRIKRLNASGYFKKSLKTTDQFEAMKRANRYWIQLREAEENHIILAPKNNFRSLMLEYFKFKDKRSVNLSATRAVRYQFLNYYEPYFGSWNVANVTERAYMNYLNKHRLIKEKCPAMRKKPTIRTLSVEQANLRSFLMWCFTHGKMRVRPDMRPIEKNEWWIDDKSLIDLDKPQRRDMISPDTYDIWRRYLRTVPTMRPRDKVESDYHEVSRRRLHFYLLTVYNFVCRAGEEVLNLKFEDFNVQPSDIADNAYFMVMTTKHGKKIKRGRSKVRELVYYSDYNYLGYFNTWIEFLRDKGYPTDPDSYVFPVRKRKTNSKYHKGYKTYDEWEGDYKPLDSQSAGRMIRSMKPKIKAWADGNGRLTRRISEEIDMFSPYSVRHIAIRQLIVASAYDFSRVAERANTSLTMIQDFYYRYGAKPEGRLVSRHPTPSTENIQKYDPRDIETISDVVNFNKVKKYSK